MIVTIEYKTNKKGSHYYLLVTSMGEYVYRDVNEILRDIPNIIRFIAANLELK